MTWKPRAMLGERGSEGGVILRDDDHEQGARITLERLDGRSAPFAITCGIRGWMVHTRFFGSEDQALAEYGPMQHGLSAILGLIPPSDESDVGAKRRAVVEAIEDFVSQFP